MTEKSSQNTIPKFLWQVIKPYRWWYLLMLQAPIVGAFFTPLNQYALKLIVDQISKTDSFALEQIIFPVILFCTASVLLEVVWRISNYADYKSQPLIEAEIINKSYKILLSYDYRFFQNNLSGKIASKISALRDNFVYIQDKFHFQIIWQVLSILITLTLLFSVHFQLAIIVLLWLIIFMPAMFFAKRRGLIYSEKSTASKQRISGLINDGISNIASVLFFCTRNFERNLIKNANNDFVKCEKKRLKFQFINHFVMGFIYSALSISVLFLLINLRQKNLISIGDFVMVMGLMFFMIETTWGLLNSLDEVIANYGTFKESFSIFKENHQVFDSKNTAFLSIKNPDINFKNITFYHQENSLVFNDFNLQIKAGEKIGLVGFSGAGKSTLVNLLLKIFKPISGDILIDDQSIYDCTSDSLRSQIALIPQDTMLFHRSIAENIGYAKEGATRFEIIEAAKKAHIHDFINSLPNGYETLVGERGIKLSGGQRQRIAIARAILKDAPILILDEATSSLDSHTENHIQQSLNLLIDDKSKSAKKTVIAIAHRLSTLKHMDRIIVLDKGKIVEDGTHEELLKTGIYYQKMWNMQAGGFLPEALEENQ
ncbi:MAG: ABC transporter ATP-binding protein/permease [Rickettsiales bacterium]|nr:ABC transporter ATP-binding protein/permease [Rickettsiales bacterium]